MKNLRTLLAEEGLTATDTRRARLAYMHGASLVRSDFDKFGR